MGCYNVTCSVSNLPIRYGEKVYFVTTVERKEYSHGFCYPDSGYKLLLPPILGTYNDYGFIEDAEINPIYLDYLNTKKFSVDNDSMEDMPQIDSVMDFLESVIRGNIHEFSKFHKDKYRNVNYFFVRKDIFDKLMVELTDRKTQSGVSTHDGVTKTISDTCEKYCKILESVDPSERLSEIMARMTAKDMVEFELPWLKSIEFTNFFFERNNSEDVILSYELSLMFSLLRKGFNTNTSGNGSQRNELQMHLVLAKAILDVIEEYKNSIYEDSEGMEDIPEAELLRDS